MNLVASQIISQDQEDFKALLQDYMDLGYSRVQAEFAVRAVIAEDEK